MTASTKTTLVAVAVVVSIVSGFVWLAKADMANSARQAEEIQAGRAANPDAAACRKSGGFPVWGNGWTAGWTDIIRCEPLGPR